VAAEGIEEVDDMRIRSYVFYAAILLVIASFIASCGMRDTSKKAEVETGYKNLVNDEEISFGDMNGYVLVINYWATWCPACRDEVPGLVELYEKYKDRKFAVIDVSVDRTGESAVKDFIKEYGISYPVIMNTKQIQKKYEEAIGRPIRAIPTSLVVDRTGRTVSVHIGFIAKDVLEQEIQPLL
jgi:thiol-disulfide isomerase/thioredoxin